MQLKLYTAFVTLSIGSMAFNGLIPDRSSNSSQPLTEGLLISVDTLMQYRIDSVEPYIIAYHSFLQRKKDLHSEVSVLRTVNDSLFMRIEQIRIGNVRQVNLADSLQELFSKNETRIQLLKNTLDSLSKSSVSCPNTVVNGKSIFDPYLHPGSTPSLYRFRFHGNTYVVCLANARHNAIRIHPNATHRLRPLRHTWKILERNGNRPIMVMNGGMYEKDGSPVGLLISKGYLFNLVERSELPIPDNFHLYPNGVFYSDKRNRFFVRSTREFLLAGKKEIQYATQSGPMLLVHDSIHPSFIFGSSNLNIRNGVGVVEGSDRSVVAFVISETKVNFYDIAMVYKYILNCKDALYLDGSISRIYFKKGNIETGDLGGELGPVISVSEK